MRVRYDKNADKKLEENAYYISEEEAKNVKCNWNKQFQNSNNPIHLEIGMGKGDFIVGMAKEFPNVNFIGLERNMTILAKAAKKVEDEKLTNVVLISNDAAELNEIFANGEIDKIYLNFSDPWPKNKHYKRRLTYREFLDLYDVVLKKDGLIEFKTDNKGLFEFTIMEIANTERKMEYISLDLHNTEEFNIMTEYEYKFSQKGNRIYKLVWQHK